MATVLGANATRAAASPVQMIDVTDQGGRMRVMYDSYVAAGVLALNDIIRMGAMLPAGARIHDVLLDSTDLGTTGTLDVGWEATADEVADPNGFLNAVNVNAAAILAVMSNITPSLPGFLKQFSAQAQIAITVSAATTAGGTIRLATYYSID